MLRTPHELAPDIPGRRGPVGLGGPGGPGGEARVRRAARQRRRSTLGVLASVFFRTLLIGLCPGPGRPGSCPHLRPALVAYVMLLVQLRRSAEERERKLSYLHPGSAPAVCRAGPPGSRVHERPVRPPSNQAAAAR